MSHQHRRRGPRTLQLYASVRDADNCSLMDPYCIPEVLDDCVNDDDGFLSQQHKILHQIQHDLQPATATAAASRSISAPLPSPPRQSDNMDRPYSEDLLHDEDFIHEQRRILRAIRNGWHEYNHHSLPPPNQSISQTQIEDERKPPAICLMSDDWMDKKPAAIPLKPRIDESQLATRKGSINVPFKEDCIASLPNGKKLHLKGTKHVYEALKRGTCAVVQCYNCKALLQVPQSSTAVYCMLCNQVTPMELAAQHSSISLSETADGAVAISLQRHELEVATQTASTTRKRGLARLVGMRG